MESKFKVGDRVRLLEDYDNEYVCADKGDCGTVVKVDRNFYTVNLDSPEQIYVHCSDIERIEPIDPKTAFLSELKDLMDKYNAHFEVNFSTQATYLIVGEERYPYLAPKWIEKE